jgi:hypothetical protein
MARQEFLQPFHMGLVRFASEVHVAERVPRNIAADPLTFGTHDDGPDLELADPADRVPASGIGEVGWWFLNLELQRQGNAAG